MLYYAVLSCLVHSGYSSKLFMLAVHEETLLICSMKSYLSSQLLDLLQRTEQNIIWDENPDMLLWVQYIGGTFASPGPIRSRYIELLQTNISTRSSMVCNSRSRILEIMRKFVWSDLAFKSEASTFWEELAYQK